MAAVLKVGRLLVEALLLSEAAEEVLISVVAPGPLAAAQYSEPEEAVQMVMQRAAEQDQVFHVVMRAVWQSCQGCRSKQTYPLPETEVQLRATDYKHEAAEECLALEESHTRAVMVAFSSVVEEHMDLWLQHLLAERKDSMAAVEARTG